MSWGKTTQQGCLNQGMSSPPVTHEHTCPQQGWAMLHCTVQIQRLQTLPQTPRKGYQRDGWDMVPHLVDRQNSRTNHLCLGRDERWHHQTRTITKAQARFHIQGLHNKKKQLVHQGKSVFMEGKGTKKMKCIDETWIQMRISRNSTKRHLPCWPQPTS